MSLSPALLELMSKVVKGESSYEALLEQIRLNESQIPRETDKIGHVPGAEVDLGRLARCGFGEVIYGEGKSAQLITEIIQAQLDAGQSALVTRTESEIASKVRESFEFVNHNSLGRTLQVTSTESPEAKPISLDLARSTFHVAVVCAGSTDRPVAEEAIETLSWMQIPYQRFDDIGVAGPQRLAAALPSLKLASAVVVIAGMEGALPAVVAGHLAAPVFAVPTSVGYGTNFGGLTPLMGMLSSCAASVAVVNIDGGFKGGYLAGMVIRQMQLAGEYANATQSVKETQ